MGKRQLVKIIQTMSSDNLLGSLYQKLHVERKDANFRRVPQENIIGSQQVKYTEMFVGIQIY